MQKKAFLLGLSLTAMTMLPAAAEAANLITNGGFEDGYVSDGLSSVPNGWTPNAAYPQAVYNQVESALPAHTGSYYLKIGDYDANPVAMLNQTFSDVVGALYTVSFYGYAGRSGDSNAYLTVSAGGESATFLDTINTWTQETFTFHGTGSDTLTIAAQTDPGNWFVDDVSVNGPAVASPGAVPEPASWAMMIVGFGMIGAGVRYQRRRTVLRYL